jgi:hypothetical protein
MLRPTKTLLGIVLLWCTALAAAQSMLGELLDANAKVLSAEDFRREIVQRVLVGPTATGGTLEVLYTTNGSVQGTASHPATPQAKFAPTQQINGEWTIDKNDRMCTTMRTGTSVGTTVILPTRCQFWFKYAEDYFISDSDSDRHAKVLRRAIKR